MSKDIGILISAKDNFSQVVSKMAQANASFNKDLEGLQKKLDSLNKTKVAMKIDTDIIKKDLKELKKAFEETADEKIGKQIEERSLDFERASQSVKFLNKEISSVNKEIQKFDTAQSKAVNRINSNSTSNNTFSGLLNSIQGTQLSNMITETASNALLTGISSAYGENAGIYASSILSGLGTGITAGFAVGGVPGAIGGAIIGTASGIINASTEVFKKKNDAFKSYVQETYDTVKQGEEESLSNGIVVASNREQKQLAFSTLLGSDEAAESYLSDMTEFASKTPFAYDELANMSKTLLAYGYDQSELIEEMTRIGDAGSALGLSGDDMVNVATYLGRMKSTNKASLEYLNPLLERGIPVFDYLAEATGESKENVMEMISKGMIPGADAAKMISEYMGEEFKGSMEDMAGTYAGLTSTLEDAQANLDNAMGNAYNEKRKSGLSSEIDFLDSETGDKLEEAYAKIGEFKANVENKGEEIKRDFLGALVNGEITDEMREKYGADIISNLEQMISEYGEAMTSTSETAGAKVGELIARSEAMAINEYHASEEYQALLTSNLDLASGIQGDAALKESYWNEGYIMGQEFSEGLKKAIKDNNMVEALAIIQQNMINTGVATPEDFEEHSSAFGISYVPYDNYPTLLHQGERVLTASEARGYGNAPSVTITGNNFTVREEADIEKIAIVLADEINVAGMAS